MDLSNVRRMSKQQYEAVREQLEELGDRVTSRHGDDAPTRQGYRRFLGTLDGLAGRLLDDDEISQRGQDLLRDEEADGAADGTAAPGEAEEPDEATGDSAWATAGAEADAADRSEGPGAEADKAEEAGVTEEAAGTSGVAGAGAEAGVAGAAEGAAAGGATAEEVSAEAAAEPEPEAEAAGTGETAVVRGRTAPPRTAGSGAANARAARGGAAEAGPAETGPAETGPAEVPVGDSWAAANARVAEENAAGDGPATAGDTGEAGNAPTVDVVFSLPADVKADRVALCGEFNDWSVESTTLNHQGDGTWSATVPLVPGTYRYKYLLDGETWENGSDADRYEENAYGTLDSVVEVS
jgi:hypothetical protein